jgi:hypothetical protein
MRLKYLFLFIFITLPILSFSQTYRFRSLAFSSRYVTSSGSWSEWPPFSDSGVLITMNKTTQRITIYSETHQFYDIIEWLPEKSYDNGNSYYSAMCMDENNTRCKMTWLIDKVDGSFIIFYFSNLELMYKVVLID